MLDWYCTIWLYHEHKDWYCLAIVFFLMNKMSALDHRLLVFPYIQVYCQIYLYI